MTMPLVLPLRSTRMFSSRLNRELDADFDLEPCVIAHAGMPKQSRIEMHLESLTRR
jgi:hypothetical protein